MSYVPTLVRANRPKVDIELLFHGQCGLATRQQLLAAGLADQDIRQQVRAGRWQRVLPALYANTTGAITIEQRRVATAMYASPSAQLTGISALTWHGFRHLPSDPFMHVLVPHQVRRSSRGFIRVHRTHRLDPYAKRLERYVVCSVARAVADACRGLSDLRAVRAIVAEAVQRGLAPVGLLEQELELAGSHRTALLRRALREIDAGARSAPEVDFQQIFASGAQVSQILWNPQLEAFDGTALPSPDGWMPEVGIALEVDSREYHLSPEDWERTMRRHNQLASYGALVLHFTPFEARHRRRHVRATVERAYAKRLADGATAAIRVRTN